MISRHIRTAEELVAMSGASLLVAKDVSQSTGFTYEAITNVSVGTGMALDYEAAARSINNDKSML